jgi:hypothetical protein
MISIFSQFLDQQNTVVEQIRQQLLVNDTAGALAAKLAFDAQIDPTLRRSMSMFDQMQNSLERAQAAA